MGKDLNQMIEAVADASTMEFERLKEFGIKARQEGENVSFTFQGVTTTVGRNSQEIQDYLLAIGNVQFAGAAAEQMDTISGAASNLSVAMDNLALSIGGTGVSEAAKDATNSLSGMVNQMTRGLETLKAWVADDAGYSFVELLYSEAEAFREVTKARELDARSRGEVTFGEVVPSGALAGEFTAEGGLTGEEQIQRQMELNAAIVQGDVMHNAIMEENRQAAFDAEWEKIIEMADLKDQQRAAEQNAEAAHSKIILAQKTALQDGAIALLRAVPAKSKGAMNAIFLLEKAFEMSRAWTAGLVAAEASAAHAAIVGGPIAANAAYAASLGRTKLTLGMMAATSALQLGGGGGGGSAAAPAPSQAVESATTGVTEAADAGTSKDLNITLVGEGLKSDADIRLLLERINEVQKDMGTVNLVVQN
jgi:hypothetical protein